MQLVNYDKHQLSTSNLTFARNDRKIFSNINLTLHSGEMLQIQGANGSGKTTLLRVLAGLTVATAGEVAWDKQQIENCTTLYRGHLAYLGHNLGIKLGLTVQENVQTALALSGSNRLDNIASNMATALKRIGLNNYHDRVVKHLSAGLARRAALARLLFLDVPLWILDEPFTALDKQGISIVTEILTEHLQRGGMIIVTRHQQLIVDHSSVQYLSLL